MSPRDFLRRLLARQLSATELTAEVARHWAAGEIVMHLGAAALPDVLPEGGRPSRYGTLASVRVDVLHGGPDRPGCLLITTPQQGRWDRSLRSFLVPPHTHVSAHAAVVLRGRAQFIVARRLPRGLVAVVEPIGPGALITCTADAPHTFASDEEFVVASMHAHFLEPDHARFAAASTIAFDTLPRATLEEVRTAIGERPGEAVNV